MGKNDNISREFSEENLHKMIALEDEIYEGTYKYMQGRTSWESIASYCCCALDDVRFMIGDDWYALFGIHHSPEDYVEVVDIASKNGRMNVFRVISFLRELGLPMVMDAREDTSYRIIQALARREQITILKDESYLWGGRPFHELRIVEGRHPELIA